MVTRVYVQPIPCPRCPRGPSGQVVENDECPVCEGVGWLFPQDFPGALEHCPDLAVDGIVGFTIGGGPETGIPVDLG